MKCLIYFGMSSMKEGTSAQLSGRGELHGGARVTTLVTLRKCTLGNKREIKTLKSVLASTKGFKGGLAWIKPSKKDMAVFFSTRAAGAHYPLAVRAGGCGRGDPSPTPQRALLRAGFARCGGNTRVPGVGTSCLGVGRPGSGAIPPSAARPLGGLPGPTTHLLWVQGAAGVGIRHRPHSALLRAVGAA